MLVEPLPPAEPDVPADPELPEDPGPLLEPEPLLDPELPVEPELPALVVEALEPVDLPLLAARLGVEDLVGFVAWSADGVLVLVEMDEAATGVVVVDDSGAALWCFLR